MISIEVKNGKYHIIEEIDKVVTELGVYDKMIDAEMHAHLLNLEREKIEIFKKDKDKY